MNILYGPGWLQPADILHQMARVISGSVLHVLSLDVFPETGVCNTVRIGVAFAAPKPAYYAPSGNKVRGDMFLSR